jgi:DNA-3-methyladenine glycosylase I
VADRVRGDLVRPDLVRGDDGKHRCRWGADPPDYREYHDREWGRPLADEVRIYEKLCLEGFQSGLSWLTILRKREGFRTAFAGFDPERVARFGARDVQRLLNDAAIVRHRGKIEAAIANARATLAVRDDGRTLPELVWSHEPRGRRKAPKAFGDLESQTPESKALSKELKRYGFRFVGPTTAYAAMQSLGLVNDHLVGCASRSECTKARGRFARPAPSRRS